MSYVNQVLGSSKIEIYTGARDPTQRLLNTIHHKCYVAIPNNPQIRSHKLCHVCLMRENI